MNRAEVVANLGYVKTAKEQHARDEAKFQSDVWAVMRRLLHEAAASRMSPEEVARLSGHTTKRIRQMMRDVGLNPSAGRNLLSAKAAEALATNADLMGIEPSEMDLMSPLAYLPMGEQMKRQLQEQSVSQVTDIDEAESVSGNEGFGEPFTAVKVDHEHIVALEALVADSEGIIPVSIESLVNMALDAFLEGAQGE